jgi:hypothetical protein
VSAAAAENIAKALGIKKHKKEGAFGVSCGVLCELRLR